MVAKWQQNLYTLIATYVCMHLILLSLDGTGVYKYLCVHNVCTYRKGFTKRDWWLPKLACCIDVSVAYCCITLLNNKLWFHLMSAYVASYTYRFISLDWTSNNYVAVYENVP